MKPLSDLLDDLTADQLRDLMSTLWVNGYAVTRANIKGWRIKTGIDKKRP